MAQYIERYQRRRLITSYFSVVLSISLVLFLMGILGLLVFNAKKLADHFKEQITLTIFLKDDAKEIEVNQLQKSFALADYVKSARYIPKEEAAEEYSEDIGENFVEFLGFNPLKNAIDLNLQADFVSTVQIEEIANTISTKTYVDEVSYDKPLIELLNSNVSRLSLWILVASAIFTLISVLLINSSIRLSIYSKRFIIKTMQMVGATKKFIRKPFIVTNVKLGMLGALLALIALSVTLFYLDQSFPELQLFDDAIPLLVLFAAIFGLGIAISYISTHYATQRFLNLRTDRLY